MNELLRHGARFSLVGLANTALGLTIIYGLMYFFRVRAGVANAIGYGAGFLMGFALNRAWTFQSVRSPSQQFLLYIVMFGLSYGLNFVVVAVAAFHLQMNTYLAQLFGVLTYSVAMFTGCKLVVFRAKPE